jgi:hypothetical protein
MRVTKNKTEKDFLTVLKRFCNGKIIKKKEIQANLIIKFKKKLIKRKGVLDRVKKKNIIKNISLRELPVSAVPAVKKKKRLDPIAERKYSLFLGNIINIKNTNTFARKKSLIFAKHKKSIDKQWDNYLIKKEKMFINEKNSIGHMDLTRYPKIDVARKEAIGFKRVRIKQPKFWFLPSGKKMFKERETFDHRTRRQYNYEWLNTGHVAEDRLRYMQQIKARKQAELIERKKFPKKREWQPRKKSPFAFFQIISRFKKKKEG